MVNELKCSNQKLLDLCEQVNGDIWELLLRIMRDSVSLATIETRYAECSMQLHGLTHILVENDSWQEYDNNSFRVLADHAKKTLQTIEILIQMKKNGGEL